MDFNWIAVDLSHVWITFMDPTIIVLLNERKKRERQASKRTISNVVWKNVKRTLDQPHLSTVNCFVVFIVCGIEKVMRFIWFTTIKPKLSKDKPKSFAKMAEINWGNFLWFAAEKYVSMMCDTIHNRIPMMMGQYITLLITSFNMSKF